jgi:hypothetical protein
MLENFQQDAHTFSIKLAHTGHYYVFVDYALRGVLRTAFRQGVLCFQVIGKDEYYETRELAAASLVTNVT